MQISLIVAGLILVAIIWALIEQKQLVTTKYAIASDELHNSLNPTSFVVLADLHNCKFGENNLRLIKKIEDLAPEFIIVAGDMINKKTKCYPSNVFSLLEQLSKKYKIYYAYGNHEQKLERLIQEESTSYQENLSSTWVEYKKRLNKLGVIFLDNDSAIYSKKNQKIRITGVSIDREFFEKSDVSEMSSEYLQSLVGEKQNGIYQILIAHNPIYFKRYADWGANLTVSGHIHGGLVRLPFIGGIISPQVRLFPKYDSGIYTEREHQMIVSRGLGGHSAMPRFFNTPEIVAITITMKNRN